MTLEQHDSYDESRFIMDYLPEGGSLSLKMPQSMHLEETIFSTETLPPSPVTGLPDIQRFPDTMGYPVISGGLDAEERARINEYLEWFNQQPPQDEERFGRIVEAIQTHFPKWK